MKKKSKSLIKQMTYPEAQKYCDDHPNFKIPNALEAQEFDKDEIAYDTFWISEMLSDRNVIYNKRKYCFRVVHPQMRQYVILVRL